jgi:hypothetical protein
MVCVECKGVYMKKRKQMAARYLLVGQIVLPELTRAIMWFAVRV